MINTHKTFITSLSHDGRGIAHINGKTTFIANSLPQEAVIFTYTKRHTNYDEGTMVQLLQASPLRATPICPFFNICGGCNLQHLQHAEQLAFKTRVLQEQLQHFGAATPTAILPPITGPTTAYRSRARLGVKYVTKKAKLLIGFHEKNGRFIADISHCPILAAPINHKILALQALISELTIAKAIPQIEITCGDNQTALIFRILAEPTAADTEKLRTFANQEQFTIYLQPHDLTSIYCLTNHEQLSYTLKPNLKLFFDPTDFTQINRTINQKLVTQALELLDPKPTDQILDLFCGLGNFSLSIAKHCAQVTGIEGNANMVQRALANAKYNQLTNTNFYSADLTKDCSASPWVKPYDKILLDPPRTGALDILSNFKFTAAKIIYISCNPATLARDTKVLLQQGYQLGRVGIVDMFPHTMHTEAIAEFYR